MCEVLGFVDKDLVNDVLRETSSGIRVELHRARVEILHEITRVEQPVVLAVLPIPLEPTVHVPSISYLSIIIDEPIKSSLSSL